MTLLDTFPQFHFDGMRSWGRGHGFVRPIDALYCVTGGSSSCWECPTDHFTREGHMYNEAKGAFRELQKAGKAELVVELTAAPDDPFFSDDRGVW